MYTIDDITEFLKEQYPFDSLNCNDDLQRDLGITGDDWFELIEAYSKQFEVDVSNCLWYYHNTEEGYGGLGQLFFKPPNKRVPYLPITPTILLDFANKGKWDMDYPEHSIPDKRHDLTVNAIVFIIFLILLVISIIDKIFF